MISSNEINGKGINISQNGFGFLTNDELIPAEKVPFVAEINGGVFKKKKYFVKGIGRLLFSTYSENEANYYNGFQIIEVASESNKIFKKIFKIFKKLKNK
jgi:hypothetical protein